MEHNMNYNTNNDKLVFKEYGRNVQQLVDFAKTVENREKRNKMAHAIVNLMGQMHPHLRNIEEFRHKLWDQLQVIAKFDLDVDAPYPIPQSLEDVQTKPDVIPYPQSRIRFKHYGKNIEHLIKKALEMEDKEKQYAFAKVIGSYMKMSYKSWNSESIGDEIIIEDLLSLSNGVLDLKGEDSLDTPKSMKRSNKSSNKNYSSSRNSHRNNNNNSRYRKRN